MPIYARVAESSGAVGCAGLLPQEEELEALRCSLLSSLLLPPEGQRVPSAHLNLSFLLHSSFLMYFYLFKFKLDHT